MDRWATLWQLFVFYCTAVPVLVVWVAVTTLCLGSFSNVIAYRLVHNKKFLSPRSRCPACDTIIPWYNNIPLVSFMMLRGKARCCGSQISWLYPAIEFLMMLIFSLHTLVFSPYLQQQNFFVMYALYCIPLWALIIAIRTDIEAMVILTPLSLWLCPLGWLAAWQGLLPITLLESLGGAALGYSILWVANRVARYAYGRDGIGEGDMDLLAMIGSFWGIAEIPFMLWAAAVTGILYAVLRRILCGISIRDLIPFAPALAAGAFIGHFYLFMQILW